MRFRVLSVLAVFLIVGCVSHRLTGEQDEFARKWQAASPTERRVLLGSDNELILPFFLQEGLRIKDVEALLGKPSRIREDLAGGYEYLYETTGRGRIIITVSKNGAVGVRLLN